jgi:hypothetical protein
MPERNNNLDRRRIAAKKRAYRLLMKVFRDCAEKPLSVCPSLSI